MALAAAQVVDALAARLVGNTSAGSRVYTSRLWPLTEAELPAWRVVAAQETTEPLDLQTQHYQHLLTVDVRAYARATADLDDTLHALAAAALSALFAAPPPYGLVLQGIDRRMTEEGEAALGELTLRVQADYQTVLADPETIL